MGRPWAHEVARARGGGGGGGGVEGPSRARARARASLTLRASLPHKHTHTHSGRGQGRPPGGRHPGRPRPVPAAGLAGRRQARHLLLCRDVARGGAGPVHAVRPRRPGGDGRPAVGRVRRPPAGVPHPQPGWGPGGVGVSGANCKGARGWRGGWGGLCAGRAAAWRWERAARRAARRAAGCAAQRWLAPDAAAARVRQHPTADPEGGGEAAAVMRGGGRGGGGGGREREGGWRGADGQTREIGGSASVRARVAPHASSRLAPPSGPLARLTPNPGVQQCGESAALARQPGGVQQRASEASAGRPGHLLLPGPAASPAAPPRPPCCPTHPPPAFAASARPSPKRQLQASRCG